MGKARPINLTTQKFARVGDAGTFYSAMLNGYPIGERVSDDDAVHLDALLLRHDEETEKRGAGIAHFSVDPAPDYPDQRCFWITRTDGSKIDFSYQHCLEKKAYD